ncbi:MAG: ImmA/IrrE family metallo-endopeptidase [bacterium]
MSQAFIGTDRLIVFNPDESPSRKASSLAHELSHILLEHPPEAAQVVNGCRKWNEEHESEADWLAAAILVPREAALVWMQSNGDAYLGACHFGVSLKLFQWRVNNTGISIQLQRVGNWGHG